MGKLLSGYKKAIIDDIISSIVANTSQYYAYAANPITLTGDIPNVTLDDYSTSFTADWQMLLGKKIHQSDILHVIKNNVWQSGTVYNRYNNTTDVTKLNFYVVTPPDSPGGSYNIFKCIDNAGGAPSTMQPSTILETSFTLSDGYVWRYITSISNASYTKFSTTDFIPIYANASMVATAALNSGVEVVNIVNGGQGYSTYNEDTIQSVTNSLTVQISPQASAFNNFYTKNAIYIYNENSATAQLRNIVGYAVNPGGQVGNYVTVDVELDTNTIYPGISLYKISPKVVFETDGDTPPRAYSIVNPTTNSIQNIVITDNGSNISRANVSIQSNTFYGTGANVYAIVPPPGGHGSDPASELETVGFSLAFNFNGTETDTIPTNISYNKYGLIKNPQIMNANGTPNNSTLSSNSFSAVLNANVLTSVVFSVGDTIRGETSNAVGTVAFSNSTIVMLTGDKTFANAEYIVSSDGLSSAQININTRGDIYSKNIKPIYVQNIDDVARTGSQKESYKLIVQI